MHVWKLPMNENGMFDQTLANGNNESSANSSLMLKIYSKFSKLPLSYARWSVDNGGLKKYLAFSEDETKFLLVTKEGDYYVLPIAPGDQEVPNGAYSKILQ